MTQGLSVLNHKNFSPFQYLIGNGCRDTFRQPARLKYAAFLIGYALTVLPDVLLSLGLSAAVIELRLLENHTAPPVIRVRLGPTTSQPQPGPGKG